MYKISFKSSYMWEAFNVESSKHWRNLWKKFSKSFRTHFAFMYCRSWFYSSSI